MTRDEILREIQNIFRDIFNDDEIVISMSNLPILGTVRMVLGLTHRHFGSIHLGSRVCAPAVTGRHRRLRRSRCPYGMTGTMGMFPEMGAVGVRNVMCSGGLTGSGHLV